MPGFHHHQIIEKKYVFIDNKWEISEAHDIGGWSDKKKVWVASYLRQQIERGGAVVGAFEGNILVGFCSVDGYLLGDSAKYANLTMLFVDDEYKRKGIGRSLFKAICEQALKRGAESCLFLRFRRSRQLHFISAWDVWMQRRILLNTSTLKRTGILSIF